MKGLYWIFIVGIIMILPDFIRTLHWMYYITVGIAIYGIMISIVIDKHVPKLKLPRTMSGILFDKDFNKLTNRFALRMTLVILSIGLIDMVFFGIYWVEGNFGLRPLGDDVELIFGGGPFLVAAFAVFVTIELILLLMSKDRKDKDRS